MIPFSSFVVHWTSETEVRVMSQIWWVFLQHHSWASLNVNWYQISCLIHLRGKISLLSTHRRGDLGVDRHLRDPNDLTIRKPPRSSWGKDRVGLTLPIDLAVPVKGLFWPKIKCLVISNEHSKATHPTNSKHVSVKWIHLFIKLGACGDHEIMTRVWVIFGLCWGLLKKSRVS